MNRILYISLLACLLLSAKNLEAIDIGISGGLNFSSVPSQDDFIFNFDDDRDAMLSVLDESKAGFHIGIFAEVSLLGFFLQPGISYSETGQTMSLSYDDEHNIPQIDEFTTNYSHIKIPLVAGMQFAALRAGLGPVFSFLIDEREDILKHIDTSLEYNSASVAYQLMVGLKISRLSIDYRFEGNLSRLGDSINIGNKDFDFDTKPRQHIITLGIVLF